MTKFVCNYRAGKSTEHELHVAGPTGILIHHCGHPTANWPYTVQAPWLPQLVTTPSGRGFPNLAAAQLAALQVYIDKEANHA